MKTSEKTSKTFSSSTDFDMSKEFLFQNCSFLQKENDPLYGVDNSSEVLIRMIGIDQLCYILHEPGAHMFLFGGLWSKQTRNIIGQVNYLAAKYAVPEVYLFDFSLTGAEETSIKQDITAHPAYTGEDKKTENPYSIYNYIYGEIATRFLTNLQDWLNDGSSSGKSITYLNRYQDPVTVPLLTEPFLFIYNKDNTSDHSPVDHKESANYPIIYAVGPDELIPDDCCRILEDKIFSHVGEAGAGITPYTNADYIRSSFSMNKRGHAYKTQDAFEKDEQINIEFITYQQFRWLLDQKGNFLPLFGGPWCAYTQGVVATINDFAIANNVTVYMTDWRLDSKHPIDFWLYPRKNEAQLSQPVLMKEYVEIWEKYLPAVYLRCAFDPDRPWSLPTKEYIDESGKKHTVLFTQIPLLFAYNRDHLNQNGKSRPTYCSCHVSGELINCSERFVYYGPFYRKFKASVAYVFEEYKREGGEEFAMAEKDRSQPIVPGMPEKHPETPFLHKEHSWYNDNSGRKPAKATFKPVPSPAEEEDDGGGCVVD